MSPIGPIFPPVSSSGFFIQQARAVSLFVSGVPQVFDLVTALSIPADATSCVLLPQLKIIGGAGYAPGDEVQLQLTAADAGLYDETFNIDYVLLDAQPGNINTFDQLVSGELLDLLVPLLITATPLEISFSTTTPATWNFTATVGTQIGGFVASVLQFSFQSIGYGL